MKFKMIHENYNVFDLDRSLAFYEKALGLKEVRRKVADDNSFIICEQCGYRSRCRSVFLYLYNCKHRVSLININ